MPLSPPASRTLAHTRRIILLGYEREDGRFDIEGHLTDTKPYSFANHDRGTIAAGEPLHAMSMRMTVDDTLMIIECEAQTEHGPYSSCPAAAPNFARLAGLRVARGFVRAAAERVGGVHGCTHLRELLAQMATVAFQTIYPVLARRAGAGFGKPALIDTCYAYRSDGPVVQRQWPDRYTGGDGLPGSVTAVTAS